MKIKSVLSALSASIVVAGLGVFSAPAFSAAVVPGAVCVKAQDPVTGLGLDGAIQVYIGIAAGVGGSSYNNFVNCPIPNGTSNGSIARFRINVTDKSSSDAVACQGHAVNDTTSLSTAMAYSSGSSGVAQTLTASLSIPSGVSSSSLAYYVECTIPEPQGLSLSSVNRIQLD